MDTDPEVDHVLDDVTTSLSPLLLVTTSLSPLLLQDKNVEIPIQEMNIERKLDLIKNLLQG